MCMLRWFFMFGKHLKNLCLMVAYGMTVREKFNEKETTRDQPLPYPFMWRFNQS